MPSARKCRASPIMSASPSNWLLPAARRLRNFIFTAAELRPDLLYSAFSTTMASLPIITTLPTRSSCAVFILKNCPVRKCEPDRCSVDGRLAAKDLVNPQPGRLGPCDRFTGYSDYSHRAYSTVALWNCARNGWRSELQAVG